MRPLSSDFGIDDKVQVVARVECFKRVWSPENLYNMEKYIDPDEWRLLLHSKLYPHFCITCACRKPTGNSNHFADRPTTTVGFSEAPD
jgi:hypothetical protein